MNHTDSFQLNSSDVTVLYAEEEHVRTNTVSGPLVRSVYIIECCIEGEGIVEINGKPFSIQAGDCYVLLPGCSTVFRNSATNPRGGYWCALEGFTVGKVLEKVGVTPKVVPIRGGTDGARLSYEGLPCPNLCTGGENFHSRFEFIPVEDMEDCVRMLTQLLTTI